MALFKQHQQQRKTERMELRMTEEIRSRLGWLQTEMGLSTLSDTIRRSLSLAEMIYQERQKGARIFLHHPNGDTQEIKLV